MKKLGAVRKLMLLSLGAALLLALPTQSQAQKPGHKIRLEVKNYADSVCYLAFRYGDKQHLQDTFFVTKAGSTIEFSSEKALLPGVYSAINQRKQAMCEFLVDFDEQHFTVITDTANYQKLEFKGAAQNGTFIEYREFVQARGAEAGQIAAKLDTVEKDSRQEKALFARRVELNAEVGGYQQKLMQGNEGKLFAYILKAQQTPKSPEKPADAVKNWEYRWLKAHYWDNFDFSDDRIIRTPIYLAKLKYFFEKMIIQHPDSVNQEIDMILGKTKNTPEFYKQTFVHLYQKYNTSDIVCMDKVYVNLALNWYTKELAFWATENQLKKIRDRAKELEPIQCGMIAPNMRLVDTAGKWHELHRDQSDYILLYFWDPDCGHCKKATPLLPSVYDKYKKYNVNIWGICTKFNTKPWRTFINKHGLNFLNVSDNAEDTFLNNMRDVYDIFSTPVVYVLDKNKRIISKRIPVEKLDEWLEHRLKADGVEVTEPRLPMPDKIEDDESESGH
jgi:peroxiredoxin